MIANTQDLINNAKAKIAQVKQQAQDFIDLKNTEIGQKITIYKQKYDSAVAQINAIKSDIASLTDFVSKNTILSGIIDQFNNLLTGLNLLYSGLKLDVSNFIQGEQNKVKTVI